MKILFLGDVIGRSGREAVSKYVPDLKDRLGIEFVIANAENAAAGFGITDKICRELYGYGVDVITTGNHVWDQRAIVGYIDSDPRLLRPNNFPSGTPGRGCNLFTSASGQRVLVINVMGRVFMDAIDCPFASIDEALENYRLGASVDAIVIDSHCEATSEKMAIGQFSDGRVSAVVGSHSHVPTADAQILPEGTAYQTDAGMCGDYDSVIGMVKDEPLRRFTRKMSGGRFSPALGEATLCGILIETEATSGLAVRIDPVRLGGRLKPFVPDWS